MTDLPDVTLLAADTANHALALRALTLSMAGLSFRRVIWLTDAVPAGLDVPDAIEVAAIAPIASRADYSRRVLKSLAPYVTTTHALMVQWDGYVVNAGAWDARFLDCDYLGARWFWHADGMDVGNGGFSLRSRRLIDALADPRIDGDAAEDELIGRTFRPLLEREYGIKFGDAALADRFSFEVSRPVGKPLGFHGLYNFARIMPQRDLAALVPAFSDDIARSMQCLQLMRNARALGQWQAVTALAARILAATPGHDEATAARSLAAAQDRPFAGVSRNDACPCGSGKRFKHCHGDAARTGGDRPDADAANATSLPNPTNAAGATRLAVQPPDDVESQTRAGLAAHQRRDLEGAATAYRKALAIDPRAAIATHYLGVVHYQRGQVHEALPLIEQSVLQRPQEAEFHNNAGLVYAALDRIDDAIAAYRRVLAIKPAHPTAWNNLGLALTQRNDVAAAREAYRRALAVNPEFAEARWNLGLALLATGEYAEGWLSYDARLALPTLSGAAVPSRPRHESGPLEGRRLLLRAEQGLGDTLQFIRFARNFAARGATVIAAVPAPLVALCRSAPGVSHCVAAEDADAVVAELELPLLSAGAALGLDASAIADAAPPYLFADSVRAARWQALTAADSRPLRVGLSWAGNPEHRNDRRRSCPLATLAPLLDIETISWYSLQHRDGEHEIAAVAAARAMRQLDARNNFDDKAALIGALDLVISVDTANAHLAGALDVPLWVLLPFAADWRWGLAAPTSPWYPRARLFRQAGAGDWASVVDALGVALSALRPARN